MLIPLTHNLHPFSTVAEYISCFHQSRISVFTGEQQNPPWRMLGCQMTENCTVCCFLMEDAICLKTLQHKCASWGLWCAVCEFSHRFTYLKNVSLLSWCEAADREQYAFMKWGGAVVSVKQWVCEEHTWTHKVKRVTQTPEHVFVSS